MPSVREGFPPARSWRAFCFAGALLGFSALAGAATPPVKAPELSQAGKAGPAEAARILEQFRNAGVAGQYYLEFELRSLPRRGDETVYFGRLWGGRSATGAVTRVEVTDAAGAVHRLLIRNGPDAKVWRSGPGGAAELTVSQLFEPLIPGVEVTAFDVQMPFLYWPEATLEKLTRTRGRPANAFFFRAPEAFQAQYGGVAAARAHLDTQFNALLQTELIGADGRTVKTFSLLTFKTVDRQPLPKSADYRNDVTRDKTRLVVTAAALDRTFARATFDPSTLGRAAEVPPPAELKSLE